MVRQLNDIVNMFNTMTKKNWEDQVVPFNFIYTGDGSSSESSFTPRVIRSEKSKYSWSFFGSIDIAQGNRKFNGRYSMQNDIGDFLEGQPVALYHTLATILYAVAKDNPTLQYSINRNKRIWKLGLSQLKVSSRRTSTSFEFRADIYFTTGLLTEKHKYKVDTSGSAGPVTGTDLASSQVSTGGGTSSADHFVGTPRFKSLGSTSYKVSFYKLPDIPIHTADQVIFWSLESIRKVKSLFQVKTMTDANNPSYTVSSREGGNQLLGVSRRVIYSNYAMLQGSVYWVSAGARSSGMMALIESPYTGETVDIYSPLGVYDSLLDTCPDIDADLRRGI